MSFKKGKHQQWSLSYPPQYIPHPFPCRLSTKEVEHSAALSAALSALRQENQLRINEAVERAQYEENVVFEAVLLLTHLILH